MSARALVWNYGGGTQSVAIGVLIKRGLLPRPELAIMVKLPREMPGTFRYLDAHVRPLLDAAGVPLHVFEPPTSAVRDYWDESATVPLTPGFTAQGRLPTLCSGNWKRDNVLRELRRLGYGPDRPITQWLGYSVDEMERAATQSRRQWATLAFPLLQLVPLRREHCRRLVLDEGLPDPPRSRCYDCGNQRNPEWREVRDAEPELFQLAVRRDEAIRARDLRHDLYLHRAARPLAEVDLDAGEDAPSLFDAGCNSAGCFT